MFTVTTHFAAGQPETVENVSNVAVTMSRDLWLFTPPAATPLRVYRPGEWIRVSVIDNPDREVTAPCESD